jgi:hypothetical protein
MGKVFYDMGFLAKAEVVECSTTELIGEYLGQTGPKVQKALENALGRVLFIDEAYRLAEGPYAKEAMDEIVDCLTKPKFAQKLVVILAGYDKDINRLMAQNPGLTSRFPEAIVFTGFQPIDCFNLLVELLRSRQKDMKKRKKDLDLSVLETPTPAFSQRVLDQFDTLGKIANWANARDVQTIASNIFKQLLKRGAMKLPVVSLSEEIICTVLDAMVSERSQRQEAASDSIHSMFHNDGVQTQNRQAPPPPTTATTSSFATSTAQSERPAQPAQETVQVAAAEDVKRDHGVSDAVWEQLQRDKQAATAKEEQYQKLLKASTDASNDLKSIEQKEKASEQDLQQAIKQNQDQAALQEAKRLREEARIQHELGRRAKQEMLDELERQRRAAEEERRREAKAQQKLRTMGVCPVGFRWIKQASGYMCAGGSHFVSDSQLGL